MACTDLFRRLSGGTGGAVAGILALAFVAVGAVGAFAAPPTVDGNIDDLLTYAASEADCGLTINDAAQDVCKTDAGIVPCVAEIACPAGGGTYFVNGFDFTHSVAAYDAANDNLYLGFRVVGQIGDANGDGDPGNVCLVPGANVSDAAGISVQEQYSWEFDTNCDGTPDIVIDVRGDAVNVIGAATSGSSFAFNGSDLEVVVNGIQLPAIWRLRPFIGSTTDGLSEDTGPPAECPPPNLDLAIEKSASVGAVCPGGTVRFTVEVTNTGEADLLVSLTDQLPTGLTYANNVSGDFTFQSEVGGLITFSDLTIPAGESRDVSFDAIADLECFGEVTNVATATGSFDEACLEAPLGVGPVQADASVICQAEPCVELDIDCPPAACEGESILLSATVTNCSTGPENITVTIAGADTTFLNVPAAGERTWERYVTHGPCVSGSVSYLFSATATSDCGTSDPVNDNCVVACEEPSIDVSVSAPAQVPAGEEFCYSIVVTNDGPVTLEDVEVCADICQYVTYAGNASPAPASQPALGATNGEICWSVGSLAPGESRNLSFCVTAVGLCPEVVNCMTPVTAAGFCADAEAEDDDLAQTQIDCPQACLEVIIIDEETIDNDIKTIEAAADACAGGIEADYMVNDDRPTEVGNPVLRWNELCCGQVVTLPSGQLYDEGLFFLPEETPWSVEDFVAGTVPQSQLDKIADVMPLRTPELKLLEGRSFVAVVYDSDISMNYGPTNGNLQGARYGLFFFTVLDVIPPGSLAESGSSSSQWDLVIRVDCVPEEFCVVNPLDPGGVVDVSSHIGRQPAERGLLSTTGNGFDDVDTPQTFGLLELYRPAPNPFTNETQIAFAIEGSQDRNVEIGIYDVAGRQVKKLVSGTHAPGRYVATWDGRDGSGVQVTRGVYFLRAIVGAERVAMTRILYLR